MGLPKKEPLHVVPFDYGESSFKETWLHYAYNGARDSLPTEEQKGEAKADLKASREFQKKSWRDALAALGPDDVLAVHGHGNGGLTLKGGSGRTLSPADLVHRLRAIRAPCHIVFYGCITFQFAVHFAILWEKKKKPAEYYGTMKIVFDDWHADGVHQVKNPKEHDLKQLETEMKEVSREEKKKYPWI